MQIARRLCSQSYLNEQIMVWRGILCSFQGRINRAKYGLASLIVCIAAAVGVIAAIGVMITLGDLESFALMAIGLAALVSPRRHLQNLGRLGSGGQMPARPQQIRVVVTAILGCDPTRKAPAEALSI